ncbi:hypothetical protein [Ranid herpesvirus 3]|uniref:Uncharacterized protein n=1 Tax=Ranid herpesvirus 3 TaxID=1987509 RepID=A0A1X9T586_9VIRU|nr:hypothetical protein [Ranid herpesvirus 3]ARR28863.1 hypothetical protein [Ranid herpesvirus 3]
MPCGSKLKLIFNFDFPIVSIKWCVASAIIFFNIGLNEESFSLSKQFAAKYLQLLISKFGISIKSSFPETRACNVFNTCGGLTTRFFITFIAKTHAFLSISSQPPRIIIL